MSEPRPAWHEDWFPEYRAERPWVMAEMIAAETDLVAPIVALDYAGLATAIHEAADAAAPIVTLGSGTSEHGALAIGDLLDDALRTCGRRGGLVERREALEAALDPRPGGVALACSHAGNTYATLQALAAAREAGATTAIVTAKSGNPAHAAVDYVLVTPLLDRSWCHTVGYLSPILAGGALAAAVCKAPLDTAALTAYVEACQGLAVPAASVAGALVDADRLLPVGGGADFVAARELALKVEEGLHLPSAARDLETLLHGHLPACDARTAMVLIQTDPRGAARRNTRAGHALAAGRRCGLRIAAVLCERADTAIPTSLTDAGRLVLPASGDVSPLLASLVGTALALQHLTLALVHEAGTNPDLIRREQAPYREAAAIASATGW